MYKPISDMSISRLSLAVILWINVCVSSQMNTL